MTCYPVKRYSITELAKFYKEANDLDKDVYKCVLRYRFNPVYNENHMKDIDEFRACVGGDEELSLVLEEILDELNKECVTLIKGDVVSAGKYLDVAGQIIEGDKRISSDEFSRRKNS